MKTGTSVKFTVKTSKPEPQHASCCVIGINEGKKLKASARDIDRQTGGALTKLLKRQDITGRESEIVILHDLQNASYQRLIVVGFGPRQSLDATRLRKIGATVATKLRQLDVKTAHLRLHELEVSDCDLGVRVRHLVEAMSAAMYRFNELKSNNTTGVDGMTLAFCVADRAAAAAARRGLAQGKAVAAGVAFARDLGNRPGNVCTPTHLAAQARKMQRTHSIMTKVLGLKEMSKLGMGSLLSVSRGSRQPPKLIVMEYKGGDRNLPPVVLVGKGLTFDAGGISLKPAAAMDEMKYDMCGGASVFGTMRAVSELKLPINVIGVVPSSENLPDGAANKPGDIVTSMSGQTIEILNTDAEGRLILCDALTYVRRFNPAVVIDIATLTGACVIALGGHASGLMANDQKLADQLLAAGDRSHDRVWQLPLWDEYQSQLDSNFADIANIGGRPAGAITAACFLSRFTEGFRWAHLDIAGTAWRGGKAKGATGRAVPLLTQFLIDRCHK